MHNHFDFSSAEPYRTLLRTSLDGFWLLDTAGRLLDVNDAYCRMTGFTREELQRMRVTDLSLAETPEQAEKHLAQILREGGGRFETRHRKKDGGLVHLEISASCVQEP